MNNIREHVRFHELQIEALAIPVSLTSAKHRCKTFYMYFIFIKWSSIKYNDWGATFAKKTVGRDLTELTRGSGDWSVLAGKLWRVDVHVESSSREHHNFALIVLFTTIKCTVIMNVIFLLDNTIVYCVTQRLTQLVMVTL